MMDLAMVTSAQWHGEFIADPSPKRWALREPYVVRVRGLPPANHTRLLSNEPDMVAIADTAWLRQR
jgi:hypothetical protein